MSGGVGDTKLGAVHAVDGEPSPAVSLGRCPRPAVGGGFEQRAQRLLAQPVAGLEDARAGNALAPVRGSDSGEHQIEVTDHTSFCHGCCGVRSRRFTLAPASGGLRPEGPLPEQLSVDRRDGFHGLPPCLLVAHPASGDGDQLGAERDLFAASAGEADAEASGGVGLAPGAAAGGFSAAKAPGEDTSTHDFLPRRKLAQRATAPIHELATAAFHFYG